MADYTLFNAEEEQPSYGLLKKAKARISSAGDTLTNNVVPGRGMMLPNSIEALRGRAGDLYQQGSELYNSDPDTTALQRFAKQRGEQGDRAMMNALAAQYAGESFAPLQEQLYKKAAASSEPMKVGGGMITAEGQYVKDPFASQDKRAEFLLQQARYYEQLAQSAETSRERIAAQRAQEQIMNQMRMMGLSIQQQGLDMRRDALNNKTEPGNFTHEGYTPDNQRIVTNSKTGQSFILGLNPNGTPSYTPYSGASIPKASYEKEVSSATEALASAKRSDDIIKMVEGNPEAFGITANLVSRLPNAVQGRVGGAVLDSNTMKVRSDVLRQAAQEINQLYGAALSAGESARASTFIPDATDPPDVVVQKLKAARDWAYSNSNKHGTAIRQSAESRGMPAQNAGGGLSADEAAELARLRSKFGRNPS